MPQHVQARMDAAVVAVVEAEAAVVGAEAAAAEAGTAETRNFNVFIREAACPS